MNVFGAIGRWTEETFTFVVPNNSATSVTGSSETVIGIEEYPALPDALDAYSITHALAPSWFPAGYKLDYVEVAPLIGQVIFSAAYSNGDNIISLEYFYWTGNDFIPTVFEKDGTAVTEYIKTGITIILCLMKMYS